MKKQTQKVKYQTIGKRLAEHYGYTPVDVTRNPGNKGYPDRQRRGHHARN